LARRSGWQYGAKNTVLGFVFFELLRAAPAVARAMRGDIPDMVVLPRLIFPSVRPDVKIVVKNTFFDIGDSTPPAQPCRARSASMPPSLVGSPLTDALAAEVKVERRIPKHRTMLSPRVSQHGEVGAPHVADATDSTCSTSFASASDCSKHSDLECIPTEGYAQQASLMACNGTNGGLDEPHDKREGAADHVEDCLSCGRTTVMVRNLPEGLSRKLLEGIFNRQGFEGLYDFVYVPADLYTQTAFEYCFVNLVSAGAAEMFFWHFQGFQGWPVASGKTAAVHWSTCLQGLPALIERYRNSPLMHPCVPDSLKPAVYHGGDRIAFPVPTAAVRAPRVRRSATQQRDKPRSTVLRA